MVITGGPGAGKTAVLELVRRHFCRHVKILPEAAGIVFGGGFPRQSSVPARSAAQRAIYRVQRELERLQDEDEDGRDAVVLCDRGTLDGLAYWPGAPERFWGELGTSQAEQLDRYQAVVHLRTPSIEHGYNHQNPLRTESAREAALIDARLLEAWSLHPRRVIVDHSPDFLQKVARTLERLRELVPGCCVGDQGTGG